MMKQAPPSGLSGGVPRDFAARLSCVRALGAAFADQAVREPLVAAYMRDTLLLRRDVLARESEVPARLCGLPILGARDLREARPSGGVAVLVPKNSVGLTIAKAVVGAWLTGNRVLVRFPGQLEHSGPLFAQLLMRHLPGIEVAPDCSGPRFLADALRDPSIGSVVIYGDDAWIGEYRRLAEETGTRILFEGPGNDPLVVLPGADVDAAVDAAIRGGMLNGGQSCSAFERFFVHRSLHAAFVGRLAARVGAMRIGSPADPATEVGPIASTLVRTRLAAQLDDALLQGARLVCGGRMVDAGAHDAPALEPAVLTGCKPGMRIVDEENFGAVFPVIAWEEHDELMAMLDAGQHGLNAAAYGPCPDPLRDWMRLSHRNSYVDSTPADAANLPTRIADGGMRRSAFVWEMEDGRMVARTGRRLLALELAGDPVRLRARTEALLAAAVLPQLPPELA